MSENELQHYGVIGMKWGVRRAINKYNKATTNKQKTKATETLNKHLEKASNKLAKYDRKGQKALAKAVKKRYGFFGSNEKYEEFKAKAERKMYKGKKWYDNMTKTFGKQSVVSLSERDKATGRRFTNFFEQTADFGKSGYNR